MRRLRGRPVFGVVVGLVWLAAVLGHAGIYVVLAAVLVGGGALAARSGLLSARPRLPGLGRGLPGLGRGMPALSPAGAEEQERSRAQVEAGGIPVSAERRLAELRGGVAGLFTSDLSVDEFALLHADGVVPLTQVMGSSIFQHGWQNLPYGSGWGLNGRSGGFVREVTSISDAFNGARERALGRLLQEARLAGADAVVAVRLETGGHDWAGPGSVEFTAVGTAVRLPEELRTQACVITDLSGQDYVKLAREGYRPVGVVGQTTVMYVAASYQQSRIAASGNGMFAVGGRINQELGDFTQGFYAARETAMLALSRQATALDADGIVGVTIGQDLREREYEDAGKNQRRDLIVHVHVLGTAIREAEPTTTPPRAALTILPLRAPKDPTRRTATHA